MKPNIVIVISDALRPKDMSLYGASIENDKNIRKIASESAVFWNNISSSNASDTSVTALFSGLSPLKSGFVHQHPRMRQEELDKLKKIKFWLPSYLQNQGYETIATTPLHLWFKKGFSDFTDREKKKTKKFLNISVVKRLMLSLPNWAYSLGKIMVKIRASPDYYSAEEVINLSIEKIGNLKDKPFFVFMHLVDTHFPFPPSKTEAINGEKELKKVLGEVDSSEQKEYIKKRFFDASAKCLEQIEKRRDDAVAYVDKHVGRLYDFLKEKNLWENTLLIVLSDHGENYGEHKTYFCRGGLYQTSIHTPLIVHVPGEKHRDYEGLTQTIDIAPTILQLLEEKEKPSLDGISLIELANLRAKRHKALAVDGFCEKRIAVVNGSRKLIVSGDEKCYLCGAFHGKGKEEYDLDKDKDELSNIYSEKSEMEREIPEEWKEVA